MPVTEYTLGSMDKMVKDIEDRHHYLLNKAIPVAIKQSLDAVASLARTKVIGYVKGKAKVNRWVIARKLPKKLQRKANVRDFFKTGTMSAKNHILTNGITYASLFGNKKSPKPSNSKMKAIQKRGKGVKAPGQNAEKQAFVADGQRRVSDPAYEKRLKKAYDLSDPVLRGNNYQVMKRTGKKAYPVEVLKVEINKYAGRAMDSFAKRAHQQHYGRIFERQLAYNMTHKVKF
jgi:hypothetical protein